MRVIIITSAAIIMDECTIKKNPLISLACSTLEPFDIHEILYDIIFGNIKIERLPPFSILSGSKTPNSNSLLINI
jgi:hypothetical protein